MSSSFEVALPRERKRQTENTSRAAMTSSHQDTTTPMQVAGTLMLEPCGQGKWCGRQDTDKTMLEHVEEVGGGGECDQQAVTTD